MTSIRDFEIHGNDLVVATHGRGFWVIDDISPLRQLNDAVSKSDAFLFKPSATEIMTQGGDNGTPTQNDEPQAPNPPNGAAIDFYLKAQPRTPVQIEVIDAAGQAVADCTISPDARPATPAMDAGLPAEHDAALARDARADDLVAGHASVDLESGRWRRPRRRWWAVV